MATRIFLSDIAQNLTTSVTLSGWVFNLRSSGSIFFLQLRDGTGRIQCVVSKKEVSSGVWDACAALTIESSVTVTGTVREDTRSPFGYEMKVSDLTVVSIAAEYPIGKKEHGVDFLMDERHLWIRAERQNAILRIRDEIEFAWRTFFRQRGYVLTDAPIFTPNACEGTTDLFEVNYFENKAYLTQSGQLYIEATAAALAKVYCFGPTFRSEKSKTRRHLTEFWMLEAESAFVDFDENMQLQEELVAATVASVLAHRTAELTVLERDTAVLQKTTEGKFPRIQYHDAIVQLQKLGSDVKSGDDLGADDETMLTKQYDRPIFIHRYPVAVKAFYMKPDPKDATLALGSDLLAPEGYGEIIGGSQRIDDLQLLEDRIKQHKLPRAAFEWYLDLRRYGSVPHSGFGIGLERTVAWICGIDHVRETIPFPRLMNRLSP
ncbi:asparagine--tRNA ligase [Candidatus Uhrbacteria bacterium]|nr:asparagine--tRNA ligase [Candidatus Uhrbacteria bacterium]